ncbi:MAG: type III-A CRISPR-associated protein Cas10/Csm1, partial [Desulfobacca sp.]|nr:type III-A CRISPR-associated protein Cas10/Csm1 [Desulfobacca sp.]
MDDTVLKIALAAFMHDIGKLVHRETLNISDEYINNHADLYQPFYEGRHTHLHAVYTAAFIEKMQDRLPRELNQAQWGAGDAFINMAAKHHRPETPLQWVVALADRVSSGWDREPYDQESQTSWRDYQRVRLISVLEQLRPEPNADQDECSSYGYPLREISPTNIFPRLKREVEPVDTVVANQEYKCHFEKFIDALRNLKHREENLELWFEHFDSLVMIYTSAMPADRSGKAVPDVSLYDHARTTAALAVAIYLYHHETATLTIDAIKDYADQKFLLINGDFYGIQDFIFSRYGDLRKYRSKILRGRSFAVSLFSELAADLVCREIGLPFSSVILNNAGKFNIVAPNTPEAKTAIQNVETRVNKWLLEVSYGENALGFSWREASAHDLVGGNFPDLWDKLGQYLERKKLSRIDLSTYAGPVRGYLDSFNRDLNPPLCPLCAKRPAAPAAQDDLVKEAGSACNLCRDHIFLGTNLVKKRHLAITTREAELRDPDNMLREPIFGYYQVAFLEGDLKNLARSGQLLKHWDLALNPDGVIRSGITTRFISGYVPIYREGDQQDERLLAGSRSETKKLELIDQIEPDTPKTLEHIAAMALNTTEKPGVFEGIDALGILKADIDDLGLLMACGLDPKRFTLSRLATLSRQLNNYFTLYLPHLLSTEHPYQDIYTVFAGGDDLFLIGPWNRIVKLVRALRQSFSEYVGHNTQIHFSAGISLQKPHTPIDHLRGEAENALKQSKDADKNRLTLFGETATWEE